MGYESFFAFACPRDACARYEHWRIHDALEQGPLGPALRNRRIDDLIWRSKEALLLR